MLDLLIVGAGPAGLTAATYFGRYRRQAVVMDGQASRARWIPTSHNIPGFARGIGGTDLLAQLQEQALRYGALIRPGTVSSLEQQRDHFLVQTDAGSYLSRYVLLATGVQDHLPDLPGAEEALRQSVLRVCPICDAFEATDKDIAVIGGGAHARREALFLRTYSNRVTLLDINASGDADGEVEGSGVHTVATSLSCLHLEDRKLHLQQPDGRRHTFDVCYAALGCSPQHRLAARLGARLDDSEALLVDGHQQTTVAGLYAAGDVVRGLNQVVVAAAEAAVAVTDIHNRLRAAGC